MLSNFDNTKEFEQRYVSCTGGKATILSNLPLVQSKMLLRLFGHHGNIALKFRNSKHGGEQFIGNMSMELI